MRLILSFHKNAGVFYPAPWARGLLRFLALWTACDIQNIISPKRYPYRLTVP